jgi:hypothetical protein
VGDREVDVAEAQRGQRRLRLELGRPHAHVGVAAAEVGHGGREQCPLGARERGDVDVAGHLGGSSRELGGRGLELREDRLGVRDQSPPGLGEPDAAAVPVEQRDAGLALERRELLRGWTPATNARARAGRSRRVWRERVAS